MTIDIIEIIGVAVTVVAVLGVHFNNNKNRICFLLWMVSNTASMAVHLAIEPRLLSLAGRDAIFLAFAVWGWRKWGRCDGSNQ